MQSHHQQKRLIFFLGSSLGNFNELETEIFLGQISETLNPGDYFLLGIDLQKSPAILEAAYNDAQGVTAAFNLNMLSHINQRFRANFNPDLFTHRAIYNQSKGQIEMYLISQENQHVSLKDLDLEIDLKKNESILSEISRKYKLLDIQNQLLNKKIQTLKIWSDSQQWFGLILGQRF